MFAFRNVSAAAGIKNRKEWIEAERPFKKLYSNQGEELGNNGGGRGRRKTNLVGCVSYITVNFNGID